jgi:hypothetical protein
MERHDEIVGQGHSLLMRKAGRQEATQKSLFHFSCILGFLIELHELVSHPARGRRLGDLFSAAGNSNLDG